MKLHKVRIHRKRPTDRNDAILAVAMLCDTEDTTSMLRSFSHKAIEINYIAERDMTEEEIESEEKQMRLHWHLYNTWEAMIEDEWIVTGDREWCTELLQISKLKIPLDDIIQAAEKRSMKFVEITSERNYKQLVLAI